MTSGLFSGSQHSCGVLPLAIHPPVVSLRLCPERSKLPTDAQPQLVSASPRRRHSLFRPFAELARVDIPLAIPAIIAGVRIATVTTIGLVTVTALIGEGGLGSLIYDGLLREFHTPLVVGTVLSVALAVVADLGLAGAQRVITPWARTRVTP